MRSCIESIEQTHSQLSSGSNSGLTNFIIFKNKKIEDKLELVKCLDFLTILFLRIFYF